MSVDRTKECPACNESIPINRGVCPECGHQTTWFKIRLYCGCVGVLFGFIIMVLALLTILGAQT